MFQVITTAASDELLRQIGTVPMGNRTPNTQIRLAPSTEGRGAIIVTVPDWFGSTLVAVLRRMGAWFDRFAPAGRIPTGRPIVTHAGASQVRNQKIDKITRVDRAIRAAR